MLIIHTQTRKKRRTNPKRDALAVEIDGAIHATTPQIERDSIKDRSLFHRGIRIVRFVNKEVLDDPQSVIKKLKHLASPHIANPDHKRQK